MSGRQISWATLTLVGGAGFIAGFGVIAAWSGEMPGTVTQVPTRTVIVGAGVDAGDEDDPGFEPIPTTAGAGRSKQPAALAEAIPTGAPAAAPEPATAAEPAAAPEPVAPEPVAVAEPKAPAPAAEPEPRSSPAPAATPQAPDTPATVGAALAPSLEKSWWLRVKGRPCHLTFGSHPGLNVRSGSLTDGKVVRWRNYSRNKAIARLFKHRNPVLTPVAFGFTKKDGPPLAVQIQFDHDGKRLEGVLALRINGRYLKLVPVE